MTIRSAFRRSRNDLLGFEKKSYAELTSFDYQKISLKTLDQRKHEKDTFNRIVTEEYEVQGAKFSHRIYTNPVLTVNQFREIFDDVGFDVDVMFSNVYGCDISMAYNVGGFVIPFWRKLARVVYKRSPWMKHLLLTKLSPGKKRFHVRCFNSNDGSWYLVSHVDDCNWLNISNPKGLYISHFKKANGNYKLGTKIMTSMLSKLKRKFNQRQNLFVDVDKIYKKMEKSTSL